MKKKRFVIEGLSELAVKYGTSNKYLAEAIALSTSLRNVCLSDDSGHAITKIICQGVLKNRSIDSLTFNGFVALEKGALEVLGQIFRENRIRSVHFVRVAARTEVIDPLVRYIADSDSIERITMLNISSLDSTNYLFGCLRNLNLKKFALTESWINRQQFEFLMRYINKSSVTSLHLGLAQSLELDLVPIASVPKSVRKLKLSNMETSSFINAMKNNKTIEYLKIQNDQIPEDNPLAFAENIQQLLATSKSLKGFALIDRTKTSTVINGVIMNTTLTALNLTVMTEELYDFLCEALLNHPTIEKVKIRSVQSPNPLITVNLIRNSKTITDLDISDSENLDEVTVKSICELMEKNSILRRIKMTVDTTLLEKNQLFWNTMINSRSLYCFEIDYSCSRPFNSTIWSKIEAVLEANPGITSIGKVPHMPARVTQLLEKNKRAIMYGVNGTSLLVKMMARRSDPFTEKLPIEIWMMILKKVRYNGINVNFEEILFRKSNK